MGEAQRNQMTKQFGKISLMEVQDPVGAHKRDCQASGDEGGCTQIKGGYLEEVMSTQTDEEVWKSILGGAEGWEL